MAFFLSFTPEGRQCFAVEGGRVSNLMEGVEVITHQYSLASNYTTDVTKIVPVTQLPVTTILSDPAIQKMIVLEGDDALKGKRSVGNTN